MKGTGKIKAIHFAALILAVLLQGCALGETPLGEIQVDNDADIPGLCKKELKDCFGEEYTLSEGVEKEEEYYNEFENRNVITRYTEWNLSYKGRDGQTYQFIFNNCCGRRSPKEHMEESLESYFCSLVKQYYEDNFWIQAVSQIPGYRENDSILYFKSFRLFTRVDIPKTSVMFKERLNYSLAEHVYFPQLQYEQVFLEFPYLLDMYVYATYESNNEQERLLQCQETEAKLREMTDKMILYTDTSLNAKIHVTMMDENGYADGFSFAVLNGEYFEQGLGIEYEIALHENFFGAIEN